MPKGLFLQNPVYMTDYCRFYSRQEKLSDRWGATSMLEKVEPRDRVYPGEVCQDETVSLTVIGCHSGPIGKALVEARCHQGGSRAPSPLA